MQGLIQIASENLPLLKSCSNQRSTLPQVVWNNERMIQAEHFFFLCLILCREERKSNEEENGEKKKKSKPNRNQPNKQKEKNVFTENWLVSTPIWLVSCTTMSSLVLRKINILFFPNTFFIIPYSQFTLAYVLSSTDVWQHLQGWIFTMLKLPTKCIFEMFCGCLCF